MVTPEPASAVPHTPGRPERDPRSRPALLACVALLLLFGTLSVSAVRNKCATIDEPLHATGAFLHVFHGDQRINPEDPPLWKYWAMLPHRQWSLNIDRGLEDFARTLDDTTYQSRFSAVTMYLTPGNDGGRFVDTSRRVMVVLGVALAALTGAWAWRLAGPVAGVVAGALLCLDPNFIAHAPLLKNDVAVSLMFLATAVAAWDVGRRASGWNVALLALLCGASAATKFSGLLVAPILVLMLLARATLVREPWPLGRRAIESTGARLGLALGVCAACAVAAVLVIWASYGFRFAPTSDPDVRLNVQSQVDAARKNAYLARHGEHARDERVAALPAPLPARLLAWAESKRLLPHAYLYGLLYTYQSSLARSAFLMGEYSETGWWYYFPLAMLFKTPLATLAALVGTALAVPLIRFARGREPAGSAAGSAAGSPPRLDRWPTLCLAIPIVVYGLSALTTNLNLGLRHVFPIYPFIFVLVGVVAASAEVRRPKLFRPVAFLLAGALAVETALAFPDYIPFFNAAFAPHRLKLLSDSNLDWGQDLPELARWQRGNPLPRMYLAYFGSVPPDDEYGIGYIKAPGGYFLRETFEWPERPGAVIAISATLLQGTHLPPSLRFYYGQLRRREPREILGGSVYLYDVPVPPLERPTREALEREAARPQQ